MTYELAKKLMDAGFPAGEDGRSLCVAGLGVFDGACGLTHECNKERIYHPTLSELIDACGDGFQSLGRAMPARIGYMNSVENDYDASTKIQWWAHAGLGAPSLPTTEYDSSGDTPEEAVSNLWLKLQEK